MALLLGLFTLAQVLAAILTRGEYPFHIDASKFQGLAQQLHFPAYLISCMYMLHVFAQQMATLFKYFTEN